jgi:hypothetical protein
MLKCHESRKDLVLTSCKQLLTGASLVLYLQEKNQLNNTESEKYGRIISTQNREKQLNNTEPEKYAVKHN